jgi:glycerol-3-phosphate acyltransferase PlsX
MYNIAIDLMGGDNAPDALIDGAKLALAAFDDISIIAVGKPELAKSLAHERVTFIEATEVIDMHDSPMLAVRQKKDSSLVKACREVREGRADAVVSAGSTGAVLAGGMFLVGRRPGIERPALAPMIPALRGQVLFIDVGANVDCQPKYLEQFGLMGAAYMRGVMGITDPSVGLANIGIEEEKGSKLYKDAHQLMAAQSAYRFIGNVEARDIMTGDTDVIVFDGFDGNLVLKHTEGLASVMGKMLKEELMATTLSKVGAALSKKALNSFKARMDYSEHGGAPLLGCEGAVIKAHGSSNARTIFATLRQARGMIANDVVGKIRAGLASQAQ